MHIETLLHFFEEVMLVLIISYNMNIIHLQIFFLTFGVLVLLWIFNTTKTEKLVETFRKREDEPRLLWFWEKGFANFPIFCQILFEKFRSFESVFFLFCLFKFRNRQFKKYISFITKYKGLEKKMWLCPFLFFENILLWQNNC